MDFSEFCVHDSVGRGDSFQCAGFDRSADKINCLLKVNVRKNEQ